MPRTKKRRTLGKGIYRDGDIIEVRVTIAGETYTRSIPGDCSLDEAKAERRKLIATVTTEHPRPSKFTLDADIPRYLKLHKHQVSYKNKRAILQHWSNRIGDRPRHRITAHDVLEARVAWLTDAIAPKTINHRVAVLHHLYVTLDGKHVESPCRDIEPLPVERTPIQRVTDETILHVDAELQRRERHPKGRPYDGAKTRARFRVLVSTGRRPSEIMRTKPADVDVEHRVWVVRDGKGGWSPGIYLNDDMLAAWRLFIEANAWGKYNTGSFAVALRNAGWPAHVRPYNARHTTWIKAVERGADMADVKEGAGHKHLSTTRIYTGVLNSRMQQLSERLDGRFGGFPVVPDDPEQKTGNDK